MALIDTNDLCVVRQRIFYNNKGITEAFKFVPPSGATPLQRIKAAMPDLLKVLEHRAAMFPEGVKMSFCHVSFLNSGRDSVQILGSTLYAPQSAGTYKYDKPDNSRNSLNFKFVSEDGHTASYWLRYLPDSWVADEVLTITGGSQNIGIRTKPAPATIPTVATFSANDLTRIQKWLDAMLVVSNYGRKWKGTVAPTATFQYQAWDSAYFNKTSSRKSGVGFGKPEGRRKAFA